MTLDLRKRVEALRDEARSLSAEKDVQIDPLRLSAELDRMLLRSDRSNEHVWRKYNRRMELWKESRLELTRAVVSFGQGAIRSLLLINGGAAVAGMTFIGNSKPVNPELASLMASSLLLFALGVLAAAIVASFAYITQYFYDTSIGRVSKFGIGFHVLAVIGAGGSISLFLAGMLTAYQGFIILT